MTANFDFSIRVMKRASYDVTIVTIVFFFSRSHTKIITESMAGAMRENGAWSLKASDGTIQTGWNST